MKKIITGLILSLFFCSAIAQNEEGAIMAVRIGSNLSFLNVGKATVSPSPGISLGFFSKANVVGKFSIEPEISAVLQNINIDFNELSEEGKVKLALAYTGCAFMGVYNINDKISIHAGPFISYLFYTSVKNESGPIAALIGRKNFFDINYGLNYGIVLELKRFDIGLRYSQGLFNIGKERDILGNTDLFKTKNSFLELYAAYIF